MMFFVPEVTPVRVAGLMQTLQATGPVSVARLESLLMPPSTRGAGKSATTLEPSLQMMEFLQLIETSGSADRRLQLHPSLELLHTLDYDQCLQEIGRRLVGKELPKPEEDAPHEGYQFARLLAWYLDQPVTKVPSSFAEVESKEDKISEPGFIPLTESRFQHFLSWAKVLGFLTPLNLARKEDLILVTVNPMPFLRRHLPEFMPLDEAISAPDWLKRLGDQYPIFDGGWIRERVRKSEDQILSASLSLAVRLLGDEGFVNLEDRKDAPRLRIRLGRNEQSFSHITRLGGGST